MFYSSAKILWRLFSDWIIQQAPTAREAGSPIDDMFFPWLVMSVCYVATIKSILSLYTKLGRILFLQSTAGFLKFICTISLCTDMYIGYHYVLNILI